MLIKCGDDMERTYTWDEEALDKKIEELREILFDNDHDEWGFRSLQYTLENYYDMKSMLQRPEPITNDAPKKSISTSGNTKYFYKGMTIQQSHFKMLFDESIASLIEHIASFEMPKSKPLVPMCTSEEDLICSIKDMLLKYNKPILEQWKKIEDGNTSIYHIDTHPRDMIAGRSFHDTYKELFYIFLGRIFNIDDFFTFNHECGHILFDNAHAYNFFNRKKSEIYMNEVPAFIMEMLTAIYFKDINFHVDQAESLQKQSISKVIDSSQLAVYQLHLYKRMLQEGFNKSKEMKINLSSISEGFVTNQVNLPTYVENLMYIYSSLIARYLINTFGSDPKEVLKFTQPLYILSENKTVPYVIEKIGVNLETLKISFDQEVKKYGIKRKN